MTRTTQPKFFHAILFMICVGALPFVSNAQCDTYYADNDLDGHGDAADAGTVFCTDPGSMYSLLNDDCDDSRYDVLPGATEICNGFDDNCDGNTDEGLEVTATLNFTGVNHICEGSNTVLQASTGTGYQYQWFRNNKAIENATASTFPATRSGSFTVLVWKENACPVMSAPATILIAQNPVAFIGNSSEIDICATGKVKLRGNSGASAYQWFKDGVAITGATYVLYAATTPGYYTLRTSSASGCTTTSDAVHVFSSCREISVADPSFSLYPNPATGKFEVSLTTGDDTNVNALISVFNMVGEQVYAQQSMMSNGRINETITLPASLATGIYFVKITAGDADFTSQLNLQK